MTRVSVRIVGARTREARRLQAVFQNGCAALGYEMAHEIAMANLGMVASAKLIHPNLCLWSHQCRVPCELITKHSQTAYTMPKFHNATFGLHTYEEDAVRCLGVLAARLRIEASRRQLVGIADLAPALTNVEHNALPLARASLP